mmetsp:Transcript_28311/g.76581  ORF Transcript_28311/g.76581 Transcript_28311/m.76581 type:complete len:492 (-) Transcript_28311:653-2128(-)
MLLCVSTPGNEDALTDVARAGFSGLMLCSTFVVEQPFPEMGMVAKYFGSENTIPNLQLFVGRYQDVIVPMASSAFIPTKTMMVTLTDDICKVCVYLDDPGFIFFFFLLGTLQVICMALAAYTVYFMGPDRACSVNGVVLLFECVFAGVLRCWRLFTWPHSLHLSTWFITFQLVFSPAGEVCLTTAASFLTAFLWIKVSAYGGGGPPPLKRSQSSMAEMAVKAKTAMITNATRIALFIALGLFGVTLFTSLQFPMILWWGFLYYDEMPIDDYRTESLLPPIIITSTITGVYVIGTLYATFKLICVARTAGTNSNLFKAVKLMLPWIALAIIGTSLNLASYLLQYNYSFAEISKGELYLIIHILTGIGGLCSSYGTLFALMPAGIRSNMSKLKPGDSSTATQTYRPSHLTRDSTFVDPDRYSHGPGWGRKISEVRKKSSVFMQDAVLNMGRNNRTSKVGTELDDGIGQIQKTTTVSFGATEGAKESDVSTTAS